MNKLTDKEIENLTNGKNIIEEYLKDPKKEYIPQVELSLKALGFKGFDDFYFLYELASYAEINACYKVVHRVTGEENPFCDDCEGMEPPLGTTERRGCMRTGGRTKEAEDSMFVNRAMEPCYSQRVIDGGIPLGERLDRAMNDPIAQAQRQKLDNRINNRIILHIADLILFWHYIYEDEPCCCVFRIRKIQEPRFDIWWRLGDKRIPFVAWKDMGLPGERPAR
jgi:hypothetical protein